METTIPEQEGFLHLLLQWGHGISAMETHPTTGPVELDLDSFNGATAFQPWRLSRDSIGRLRIRKLQWGATAFQPWRRGVMRNEMKDILPASMGPRHFSHGDQIITWSITGQT